LAELGKRASLESWWAFAHAGSKRLFFQKEKTFGKET